jgi:hypothetical protein
MKPKTVVKFIGVDSWNRPIFRGKHSYYGSVNHLFDYDATKETVKAEVTEKDLRYFGEKFGCEPCGTACNVVINWEL